MAFVGAIAGNASSVHQTPFLFKPVERGEAKSRPAGFLCRM